MSDETLTLEKILKRFDIQSESFSEYEVEKALRPLSSQSTETSPELLAERMAFGFIEDYKDEATGWGTYYGPMMVLPNEQGQMMESPSIKLVTEHMLTYWSQRAVQAKHPIMKARYAGLVWDFSRNITGKAGNPNMARITIDANLEIVERHLYKHENEGISKLERALSLALQLNDVERIGKIKRLIISFEDFLAAKGDTKLRGFAYDLLIEKNRLSLTESEINKIIADLEAWLYIVTNTAEKTSFDPFAAEEAAFRLAKYYRKVNSTDKLREALLKYGNAFLEISKKASALVASSWLQKVYSVYREFGLMKEADEIAVLLRQIGEKSIDEMKAISGEIKITKKEMEEFTESLTKGEVEKVLTKIASYFVPSKNEVEKQVKALSKKAVLSFLISRTLQDYKGRPVAKIGPLHEDLDGHLVSQMSQNMSISSIFLRPVIKKIKEKDRFSIKALIDYLYASPVFDIDKKPIIEAGFKAYFDSDHLVAVHLLIPQIEDALRNLVEKTGNSIFKYSRAGSLFLKNLDDILREEAVIEIFGEDITFYLRALLTDQRGWNLRNSVCHGLNPYSSFSSVISDRVFHVLILLAQIRLKKE